jgi:CW-type Zinc Finger
MSSLRLALKQSLEVASAEGVVIPKKSNKIDRAMSKYARSRSIDDGHKSDSSEENEASLQDLQDESGSGSSEEEVGEIVGTPEKCGSGSKAHQLNTAAHKIQSQFRKKKDKKPEGSGATKTRTKKTTKQRRSSDKSAVGNAERQTLDGTDQPDEGDDGSSSDESETWTVAPPSEAVIKHMMSLSIDTSRRMMTPGLRVKVHFDRSAWYGGWVSDVNKDGSKIRIRYDDGNTEDTSFPDLSNTGSVDIVVDAVQNGQHAAAAIEAASVFLPLSDAVTRPAHLASPNAAIDEPYGTVPSVSDSVHRNNPSQSTSELEKLETSLAERLIAKSDSREEGELLEPYVAPLRLNSGDSTPLEQPGMPSEKKPLSSSQGLLVADSVPKAYEGESSVDDKRLANLLLRSSAEAELGSEVNADSLMRGEENAADNTPKPKRKRGRPPKQRPSDGTDLVETEERFPIYGEPSSFTANEPKVEPLDEGNAAAAAAAVANSPVEPVRIVPSLKIRMPKSSGDGGSKSLKSPRSPTATFERVNDEASMLQSNAKSGPLDRKRSLASDFVDHPAPKKLSIRIPIHKVKSTLQDATLRSPKVEQSALIVAERKVVEESHPRDQPSPRSQPSSVFEPDRKVGHGDQQVSIAPSIKSSTKSSPVSTSDQQSPLLPKPIKKLKKKLLLSSGGALEGKKGDLDQLERDIAQTAASGESASNETFGESMATSTGYDLDRAGNELTIAPATRSAMSSDEAQITGMIEEDFGRLDFSLEGPIRSERRAAQQANERIAAKQEVTLPVQSTDKKKKKRDRQKEMEGGVPRTGVEEFEVEGDDRWAQCDSCGKWRVIPSDVVQHLPKQWYCSDNTYDPKRASCDAPEQTPKEVAKEKKKRMKKRQRMMKAAEAAEGSSTPKLDEKGPEPPVDKEKPLDQVKSPRPARESQEDKEKPLRPPKRSSPVDEIQARETISDVRPRKEKKVPAVGKKVRAVEPAEKPPEEEFVPVDVVKPRGRGRPRRNQVKESISDVCQPIVEDASNLEWVLCERCSKWRQLPPHISAHDLPDVWTCDLNSWNSASASCDAPEDKAEGLQDIGVFGSSGASAGKLTYRHLIFGSTGRKANRPISERVRAAESLFATQFDEDDAPSKVLYADSSVYISRGRSNNASDDNVGMSMLELMNHSHLWRELRGANQVNGNGMLNSQVNLNAYTFDTLPLDVQRAMKDYMLHVLDVGTFSGDDIVNLAKQPAVESLPEALRKAHMYCTENVVITTLCHLVKEGKVDCIQKITNSWPIREWNPLYRRAMKRVPPPFVAPTSKPRKTTPRVSRFMKISKPWKHATTDKGYGASGDSEIKSTS